MIASSVDRRSVNFMTVDVEEYFQGPQFEHLFGVDQWPDFEGRIHLGLDRLLNLFAEFNRQYVLPSLK